MTPFLTPIQQSGLREKLLQRYFGPCGIQRRVSQLISDVVLGDDYRTQGDLDCSRLIITVLNLINVSGKACAPR